MNALFCEVNPIPVKKAMNLMGKEVGPLRAPLTEMDMTSLGKANSVLYDVKGILPKEFIDGRL